MPGDGKKLLIRLGKSPRPLTLQPVRWWGKWGPIEITINHISNMKLIKILVALLCVSVWLAVPAFAADKTCCERAKADGKECTHPCCVTAHKAGKSCEKCNPDRQDLKGAKTCCEKAKADGKACTHACCVTARKDGKTCEKCNPRKK